MAAGSRPEDGLLLLRDPRPVSASTPAHSSQVMRLTLAQSAAEEVLKSFRTKEKVSLRFGPRIVLQHGKKSHPVFCHPESNPSELYRSSSNDHGTFYFSGKTSHRLETERAQKDVARADEALANLESSLKSYEAQKASNEARFVTDPDELRHLTKATQKAKGHALQSSTLRKDRLLGGPNRSGPSSPFLPPASSPALGPTATVRSAAASMSKEQVRLSAIKIPFLHLLAASPVTPEVLEGKLHAPKDDCQKLLHKYARDAQDRDGKQELKDKAYRELNVWKFPYPHDADRLAAVERAKSAFDRMRISTSDPTWETLLPLEERGKGKGSQLSRLKIAQSGLNGPPSKRGANKAAPSGGTDADADSGKPEHKDGDPSAADKSQKSGNGERKPTSRSLAAKQSRELKGKPATKNAKKAQPSSKFKSSEVIEDSDEELEGVKSFGEDAAPKEASRPKTTSSASNHPTKTPMSTATNKASSAVQVRNDGALSPSSAVTRPRPDGAIRKPSPRPRTDSSPQKPSPLASSPPTNATDLDNSHSSKTSSLSSVTFASIVTPPSDDRGTKIAVSETKVATTLKRKATDQSSPAPKRQHQVNGTHIPRNVANDVPAVTSTSSSSQIRRPRIQSSSSSISTSAASIVSATATPSSSSSSPPSNNNISSGITSNATRSTVTTATTSHPPQSAIQLKSRHFKTLYARYQRLHTKIMSTSERQRDATELKLLNKMHSQIKELKGEIWRQWEGRKSGTGANGVV